MRKPVLATLILASAAMLSGCGEDVNSSGDGVGRISPSVDVDTKVVASRSRSRAEAADITAGDLQLKLTAADGSYSNTWTSIAEFPFDTQFKTGSYTMEAFYGDIADEGFEKPYYYGSQQLTVAPDKTTDVALSASLANSMVTVAYTEAFRNYMTSYGATLHSAGGAYINYDSEETRPAYLRPGNVTLSVALTKPNGKSATIEAASFTAEPRHHYTVTVDVNNGNVGDAVLTVTFDDTLDEESVEIELSDELMNAPAPTAVAQGFDPDTAIDMVGGDAAPSCKMALTALGKLSSVTLTTSSASLLSRGWPAEVNLMALSDAEQATLAGLGLMTLGLWKNPDRMAIIDFTSVISNIRYVEGADNLTKFTVVVKDRFSKVSEPLSLSVNLEPVILNITNPQLTDHGATSTLSFNLEFNGSDPASEVEMQYANERGTWTSTPFASIAPLTRTASMYAASITVPSSTADIAVRAIYKKTSSKSEQVIFSQPSFEVAVKDADVYANRAKATLTDKEGNAAALASEATLMISTDGVSYSAISPERNGTDYSLTSLTPATTYYIKAVVNGAYSKPTVFKTEAAAQLPNAGMNSWSQTDSGSYWELIWCGASQADAAWGTNNPMTTSQGSAYAYCRISGTISTTDKTEGTNAALIRTVGWGSGNTAAGSNGSSGVTKYVDAGLLHLGASRTTRPSGYSDREGSVLTEDLNCGISFASRPAALTFMHKYVKKNSSDSGIAEVWVKDIAGNIIAQGSAVLNATAYTATTIPLTYQAGAPKAAKIYVKFQSTNDRTFLEKNNNNLSGPGFANLGRGTYMGSQLYIDDIQLTY